ncbi:hypothetical protein PMAYCL1PPCAC_21228 [Pristionchus mayeri]|uniref:Uncharacterized protein n=1 Tax=Pristionchus mayeri TaxID=1317129 RepID=A0AAN5CUC1_9BILA|nr:hypothetical protein PMAYCL1PPCAC_21228 [Pristionchus mayeri]
MNRRTNIKEETRTIDTRDCHSKSLSATCENDRKVECADDRRQQRDTSYRNPEPEYNDEVAYGRIRRSAERDDSERTGRRQNSATMVARTKATTASTMIELSETTAPSGKMSCRERSSHPHSP